MNFKKIGFTWFTQERRAMWKVGQNSIVKAALHLCNHKDSRPLSLSSPIRFCEIANLTSVYKYTYTRK